MADNSTVHSRLCAVVAIRKSGLDALRLQLASGVMSQFGGEESTSGTWIFPSASGALLAAHECFQIGEEEVCATVFTGELETDAPFGGPLIDHAVVACHAIKRPGVYACAVTQRIVAD